MSELGYPTDDHDQVLADLSVGHASVVGRYRNAEEISRSAAAGSASTEDLRVAMIDYRALFRDVLGVTADAGTGSQAAEPAHDDGAEDEALPGGQSAETRPGIQAGEPAADGPDQLHSRPAEGELTR